MGGAETKGADCTPYLVVDGHAAGRVLLEDFGHPVGEPLIFQLGLLLAVLLLVDTEHTWMTRSSQCNTGTARRPLMGVTAHAVC